MPASDALLLFCEKLKLRMSRLRMTQKQVAAKCGMHRPYICKIVNGLHEPTLVTASRISQAVGMSLSDLLTMK